MAKRRKGVFSRLWTFLVESHRQFMAQKYALFWLFGLLIAGMMIPVVFSASLNLFEFSQDVIGETLGASSTSLLFKDMRVMFTLCSLIFFVILILWKHNLSIPFKWTFFTCLLFMFALFGIGISFIQSELGLRPVLITFEQMPHLSSSFGMVCYDENDWIVLSDEPIKCAFNTPFVKNYTGVLEITTSDYSDWVLVSSELTSIDVILPANANYSLKLSGYDYDDNEWTYNSLRTYSTMTSNEYRALRKDFITHVLALLGIILFTVPSAFVSMRSLWYKQEK